MLVARALAPHGRVVVGKERVACEIPVDPRDVKRGRAGQRERIEFAAADTKRRRRQRDCAQRRVQRGRDNRPFRAVVALPGDDDILPSRQRASDRFPRLASHDHCVSGGQGAEVLHVGGQAPGKGVSRTNDAVPGHGGDYRECGDVPTRWRCHNAANYNGRPFRVYYPRSFLKFILLGFLLVSLPLLYALGELIYSLDRLASQSRQEVLQAAQAGRSSRLLFEQATTLERLARQQMILEDPALLEDYARVRQDFRGTTSQLAQLPLEAGQLAALTKLDDSESRLRDLLVRPARSPDTIRNLTDGYSQLVESAQGMLTATNQLTQRAIEQLQETAAQGREKWIYLALATVAIALALAIFFAVLIARPIRQLDQAIRQMGTADFTHAIEVNGPQDLRYVGQRLEWLRTRLHELEEQQNRFLRHVSHELKTPLTAVREGAELLRDNVGGRLAPEQQEIVRIVRENTLSLQRLIEDLLKYHQTGGMEQATLGPVAMPDVVRRVVREQMLAALARIITVDVNVKPVIIVGDTEKIRTVIDNLLSNAIKYSPRAGVIQINLGTHSGFAVLDVIDQGPGVAAADRERIFESFYTGKAPADGKVKGSGLGLAIAREYALAHGGRIEVLDRADKQRGTCFRLSLPLAAGMGESTPKQVPSSPVTIGGHK